MMTYLKDKLVLNLRGRIAQRATQKAKGTFKGTPIKGMIQELLDLADCK